MCSNCGRFATENPDQTEYTLEDIGTEREAQFKKWGPQHHPDGTGPDGLDLVSHHDFPTLRDIYREMCDVAAEHGAVTWRHILLEEVFEGLAEEDPAALRKELIQVAAVAAAWVEDIDSRLP